MTRVALGVAVALLTVSRAAAQPGEPGQPGYDERRNAAATLVTGELERFTGPVDRHCGIFILPAAPDQGAAVTPRQIATALRCVQAAKKQGRASWAIWQVPGVDATTFAGFAVSRFSDVHLVDTGASPEDVALRPCALPRVAKDGAVTCRNQPVDAPSLRQAIDRFHDDLARSFGKAVASTVDGTPAASVPGQAALDPVAILQQVVARGRETLRASTGTDWPMCPIHRTHALTLRERYWFCDEDRVFVAPLGRLPRLRPAHPLP